MLGLRAGLVPRALGRDMFNCMLRLAIAAMSAFFPVAILYK